ncbi:MAG TPA: SIR2 family protein [Frankiaceae bacterium]|jgi:tetratricopeptide (TPR) repeat protein|nr:SIR2 family protein [Frankiaceae bacterium]
MERLVVLAGAGVSAIPPSEVPSWWGFNNSVLEAMKARTRRYVRNPGLAQQVASLGLDEIGVAVFSAEVADAFAGSSWFDALGCLDGDTPSPCHDALATLAGRGELAAIVTTNFDTLIEQAFQDAGVPLDVYMPGGSLPPWSLAPDDPCILIKVHGSVTRTSSSLVDLATQKRRGLPPNVQAWLARLFASHRVLVAGFSGADLDLSDDYFGVWRAAPTIPWLRWTQRGGHEPSRGAAEVVAAVVDGAFAEGDLPDVLATLGLDVPAQRPRGNVRSVDDHINAWFAKPHIGDESVAACLARMLQGAGYVEASDELRRTIRSEIRAGLTRGVAILDALRMSNAIAMFGNDLVGRDDEQALVDLRLCEELTRTVVDGPAWAAPGEEARGEILQNLSGVKLNTGAAYASLDRVDDAACALAEAVDLIRQSPDGGSMGRWAAAHFLDGVIARLRDDMRGALVSWRQGARFARAAGVAQLELAVAENRWRTAIFLGEVELAKRFQEEAATLRSTVVGSAIRRVTLPDLTALAFDEDARVAMLLRRLHSEICRGGDRVDEVLYELLTRCDAEVDARVAGVLAETATKVCLVQPLSGAVVAVAYYVLTEGDDVSLLADVPRRLTAWIAPLVGGAVTRLDSGLILVDRLREALHLLARRWGQAGVSLMRKGDFGAAEAQFWVAAAAFLLASDADEGIRALSYASDALVRQERWQPAAAVLDWCAATAGPAAVSAVLARNTKFLLYRAVNGDLAPAAAIAAAAPLVAQLRVAHAPDELGSALTSLAQLHEQAGNADEAMNAANEALSLLTQEAHRDLVRELVSRIRESTAGDAIDG